MRLSVAMQPLKQETRNSKRFEGAVRCATSIEPAGADESRASPSEKSTMQKHEMPFLAADARLTEVAFYIRECQRNANFRLTKSEELLSAELEVDGLRAWSDACMIDCRANYESR